MIFDGLVARRFRRSSAGEELLRHHHMRYVRSVDARKKQYSIPRKIESAWIPLEGRDHFNSDCIAFEPKNPAANFCETFALVDMNVLTTLLPLHDLHPPIHGP